MYMVLLDLYLTMRNLYILHADNYLHRNLECTDRLDMLHQIDSYCFGAGQERTQQLFLLDTMHTYHMLQLLIESVDHSHSHQIDSHIDYPESEQVSWLVFDSCIVGWNPEEYADNYTDSHMSNMYQKLQPLHWASVMPLKYA